MSSSSCSHPLIHRARVRILLPISGKTQNLMALGALLEAFFFVFCAPSAAILNNLLTHAKEAFLPLMGNRMRVRARTKLIIHSDCG